MTESLPVEHHRQLSAFERFAAAAIRATGSSRAFGLACAIVATWAISGPLFHYSQTWQLVINTGTTVVTFLMVFLLQQAQNKDSVAIHLKLNELLASHESASNRLIAVESLSDEDLQVLRRFYAHLADLARKEAALRHTHSLDEAVQVHARKRERRSRR